jgi:hypothetical protein
MKKVSATNNVALRASREPNPNDNLTIPADLAKLLTPMIFIRKLPDGKGTISEAYTFFRISPGDLFGIKYGPSNNRGSRTIEGVTLSRADLSLPLFEWDLENYSATIIIGIEEVDPTESATVTNTTTSEFATNFEFNVAFGEKVKVGGKFGASQKQTISTAFVKTISYSNDDLGEVIINFGDDVITSRNLFPMPNGGSRGDSNTTNDARLDYNTKYSTGWYRLYIAPKQTSSDTGPNVIANGFDDTIGITNYLRI